VGRAAAPDGDAELDAPDERQVGQLGIQWNCVYYNPTTSTMSFGESANTSDMCIYMGQYYPADGTPSTNANYPDIVQRVRALS